MFSDTPVIMMMIMYWLLMKNIQHESNDDGDEKPLENYSKGWYIEKAFGEIRDRQETVITSASAMSLKIINNQLKISP